MTQDAHNRRRKTQSAEKDQVSLLIALASMHYLYRKFTDALKILAIAEHIDFENRSILELKIVLLAETGDHDRALSSIRSLERKGVTLASEILAIRQRSVISVLSR